MNSDLHQLLHSLSQAEKRYFRTFARRHLNRSDSVSEILFDGILGQDQYDEAALKQKFVGETFVKHWASEKHYLYNLTLRSLRAYNSEKTARRKIRNLLEDAHLLWDRGLYGQAGKRLYKAKKLASKYERFSEMLDLLSLERRLITAQRLRGMEEGIEQNLRETEATLQKMLNALSFQRMSSRVFVTARREFSLRNPDVIDAIDELAEQEILQGEEKALSFPAKRRFFEIKAIFAQLRGNWEGSYANRQKIIDLWEAHPHFIVENAYPYLIALANFLAACHQSDQYTAFGPTLEKLSGFPPGNADEEAEIFQNAAYYELLFYMNQADFERAAERVDYIEEGLIRYADKINKARELAFFYNLAILYFMMENWRASLRFINRILHDERSEHRIDLQQAGRILQLILHNELGNEDLLDYLFRQVYRFLYTRQSAGQFEKAVLKFLKRTASLPPGKERFAAFRELRDQIGELAESETAPGMTELGLWLEAKIRGISLEEMWRERIEMKKDPAEAGPD